MIGLKAIAKLLVKYTNSWYAEYKKPEPISYDLFQVNGVLKYRLFTSPGFLDN